MTTNLQQLKKQLHDLDSGQDGYYIGLDRSTQRLALNKAIQRAEYESVTVDDLLAQQTEIIASIRALDTQAGELEADLKELNEKRHKAESASLKVSDARRDLEAAREELETRQGEAFIADRDEDFTPYLEAVERAKKNYNSVNDSVALARAALPKLTERIENNEAERKELVSRRNEMVKAWWTNRMRQAEVTYRERALSLMEPLQILVSADLRIGSGELGASLLNGVRQGLKIPYLGKYSEPVDLRPWFKGDSNLDIDIRNRLDNELSAALTAMSIQVGGNEDAI